jgi:hypothetical protein
MDSRIVLGLTETITVLGKANHKVKLIGRIDTGATKSSLDGSIAKELSLGPVVKTKLFRSAHGHSFRPMINVNIIVAGKKLRSQFSIADRNHMKYRILIGQNILKKGFLIDPLKTNGKI